MSQAVQPESRPDEAEKPSAAQDQPPSTSQVTDVSEQGPLLQTAEDTTQKKRKRSPSPDVIPNPAGCSYGLDLDYFCYSSDSEEEADVQPQQALPPTKPDALVKSAVRSAMRSEQASAKRVRFDASPEDTPSKLRTRPRATDPYTGRHFIGMGDAARVTTHGSLAAAPATPTPAPRVDLSTPQRSPGFIPNKQGTFSWITMLSLTIQSRAARLLQNHPLPSLSLRLKPPLPVQKYKKGKMLTPST